MDFVDNIVLLDDEGNNLQKLIDADACIENKLELITNKCMDVCKYHISSGGTKKTNYTSK